MNKGFILIELIVVIAIIAILYGIILFSVTLYINRGKDANVSGNLAVLIPAGEVYYNAYPNKYQGFCSSTVANNAFLQMPPGTIHNCAENYANDYQGWVACAREFTTPSNAYCVDSRGMKKEILNSLCTSSLTQCP